ncbi:aminomethyltransferase [Proteus mirabilis]|uniref:Aminomethyltransferase n=1 Tax=Proteus mirabilis TaxID=584 RepID=A0A379GDK2_PROMI|nr:aminomethyltransferase [Proteus mirabilis]
MNSDAICQQIKKVLDKQDERGECYQIDAIASLTPDWRMICLEGPYAWEILSEIVGMDIIGLPFHEFMYVDEDVIYYACW